MSREILKNVFRILTLTCDQAARLMSGAQDRPLKKSERWALSFHLLICRLCRKYNRQLKLLRALLSRMPDSATHEAAASSPLDPQQSRALRDRLSKKIRENLDSM